VRSSTQKKQKQEHRHVSQHPTPANIAYEYIKIGVNSNVNDVSVQESAAALLHQR
jgi:hypothetical protein